MYTFMIKQQAMAFTNINLNRFSASRVFIWVKFSPIRKEDERRGLCVCVFYRNYFLKITLSKYNFISHTNLNTSLISDRPNP